jgi:hypothetical protein
MPLASMTNLVLVQHSLAREKEDSAVREDQSADVDALSRKEMKTCLG